MRFMMRRFVIALVLGLMSVGPCMAEGAGQGAITSTELDKFMADYPAYRDWIMKNATSSENDYSTAIAAHLKSMGWDNDRYFHILSSVSARLAEAAGTRGMDEAIRQMKADRDRLKDNPNLTPEDKATLLAEIDRELGAVSGGENFDSGLSAPEKKLIDAHRDALEKLLGEDVIENDVDMGGDEDFGLPSE